MESQWKSSRAINVSDEQFKRDLEQYGTLKLAEIYGVSKNTVTDMRKRLGIQSKYKKSTNYRVDNDFAIFTTTKGIEFIVDLKDVERIKNYSWYISHQGYVISDSPKRATLLHRLITDAERGYVVDHINHETLDNRKCNLRVVTQTQNNMNRRLEKRNTSTVTGVSWFKANERWSAYISVNKKRIHLGYFNTLEEAKEARGKAEEIHFGKHAYQQ